jgi:uncharacterized protein (DUF362 family)
VIALQSFDAERRAFCRLLGCAALGACAGGLSGCARLLDWSSSQHGDAARLKIAAPATPPSVPASSAATGSPKPPALPDLAVYRGDDPAANVRAALAALGGMSRYVKRGGRVVIKPNLLTARAPEYAVTTNPVVVGTLVRLAFEAGASEVTALDRSTGADRQAFEVSGIAAAVQAAGGSVKYLTDRNFEKVAIPQGRIMTEWPLVTDVFEADTFINVPIAKTHSLAVLTMAMKNLMGIMGGVRGTMHQDFDQRIVDLNSLVRPHLVVLDATRILVRNGPTGGDLADVRDARTVVAGTNQASVDAWGTTLFGMKPADLGYLVRAGEQGIGEIDLAKLNVKEGAA